MRTKGAQRPRGRVRHDVLAPRAVFLVGFMGAGKTSVGRALGAMLGWPFEDLDERIQKREGRSIENIFRESGEAAFRQAEHSALRELLSGPAKSQCVVALGGGAFAQEENTALLRVRRVTCGVSGRSSPGVVSPLYGAAPGEAARP